MLQINKPNYIFTRLKNIRIIISIAFAFLMLSVFSIFFEYLMPFGFYFYSFITLIVYTYYFSNFPKRLLSGIHNNNIIIFKNAFLVNLVFTSILLVNYYFNVQSPYGVLFGYDAADATGYNLLAKIMANDLWHGQFYWDYYVSLFDGYYSDMGYVLFLLPFYFIVGPYLWVAALANILVTSLSLVLIYKISLFNFDKIVAAISVSSLIAFPQFFLYSSVSLKEMTLIWLMLNAMYYGQKFIIQKSKNYRILIIFMFFTFRIALFRTFLSGILLISFLITFINYNFKRKSFFINIALVVFALLFLLAIAQIVNFTEEASQAVENASSVYENTVSRRSGSTLVKLASLPVALAVSIPGPFATFVATTQQENIWLSAIGVLIRNVMVFLFVLGLIHIFKKHLKENMFFILLFFSYIFVIGYSGYFTSTRYQLIVVPIYMIISAVGIRGMKRKSMAYTSIVILTGIVLFWNYMKIQGSI